MLFVDGEASLSKVQIHELLFFCWLWCDLLGYKVNVPAETRQHVNEKPHGTKTPSSSFCVES